MLVYHRHKHQKHAKFEVSPNSSSSDYKRNERNPKGISHEKTETFYNGSLSDFCNTEAHSFSIATNSVFMFHLKISKHVYFFVKPVLYAIAVGSL